MFIYSFITQGWGLGSRVIILYTYCTHIILLIRPKVCVLLGGERQWPF